MGSGKSPRFNPAELYDAFTMSGKMDVDYGYFFNDDLHLGEMTFRLESFGHYAEIVRRKLPNVYDMTDIWFYEALNSHSIKGKTVAVFGSSSPWYESVCLHYGAKKVVTFEYRDIVSEHPDVSTTTYEKYFEAPFLCDVGISISSFEHDGLGRYGDPVDPFGDFKAMQTASKIIKPGGLLFLAVPVGRDRILWNANRIYGQHRLPKLLDGYAVLATFGFDPRMFLDPQTHAQQPIFVLQNRGMSPLDAQLIPMQMNNMYRLFESLEAVDLDEGRHADSAAARITPGSTLVCALRGGDMQRFTNHLRLAHEHGPLPFEAIIPEKFCAKELGESFQTAIAYPFEGFAYSEYVNRWSRTLDKLGETKVTLLCYENFPQEAIRDVCRIFYTQSLDIIRFVRK